MAGSMVEHPHGDSDTKLTASTDQQVDLTGIEQLGRRVDANVLWTSRLDDKNLSGGDVFDGTHEVGERDGDGGELERRGGVCIKDSAEEGRQSGRVPPDQRDDIDDASGSISREFDRFGRVLVVDIETECRKNILDDGEVRASAGVEDDIEGFETGSLEPSPCGGESSGDRSVHNDRLGVDAELDGESFDLSLGRDGVESGATKRLDDLDSGTSNSYNDILSIHTYEIQRKNLRERAS
jgi:hypothetical protein